MTKENTQTAIKAAQKAARPTARTARPKNTNKEGTAMKASSIEKSMNPPVPESVSGDVIVFEKAFVQEFKKHDSAIRKGFKDAGKSFFAIAFNLYWVHSHDAFKAAGKDNIYDYARDNFDISRGTTHNYLAVAERFGRPAAEADILVIRDEYSAYSPSQLSILAPHTDDDIAKLGITPSMSCRDIKRSFTAAIDCKDVTDTAADSGETSSSPSPAKEEPRENIPDLPRNVLITCTGKDDYLAHEEAVFNLIHNLLSKKPDTRIEVAFYDCPSTRS